MCQRQGRGLCALQAVLPRLQLFVPQRVGEYLVPAFFSFWHRDAGISSGLAMSSNVGTRSSTCKQTAMKQTLLFKGIATNITSHRIISLSLRAAGARCWSHAYGQHLDRIILRLARFHSPTPQAWSLHRNQAQLLLCSFFVACRRGRDAFGDDGVWVWTRKTARRYDRIG